MSRGKQRVILDSSDDECQRILSYILDRSLATESRTDSRPVEKKLELCARCFLAFDSSNKTRCDLCQLLCCGNCSKISSRGRRPYCIVCESHYNSRAALEQSVVFKLKQRLKRTATSPKPRRLRRNSSTYRNELLFDPERGLYYATSTDDFFVLITDSTSCDGTGPLAEDANTNSNFKTQLNGTVDRPTPDEPANQPVLNNGRNDNIERYRSLPNLAGTGAARPRLLSKLARPSMGRACASSADVAAGDELLAPPVVNGTADGHVELYSKKFEEVLEAEEGKINEKLETILESLRSRLADHRFASHISAQLAGSAGVGPVDDNNNASSAGAHQTAVARTMLFSKVINSDLVGERNATMQAINDFIEAVSTMLDDELQLNPTVTVDSKREHLLYLLEFLGEPFGLPSGSVDFTGFEDNLLMCQATLSEHILKSCVEQYLASHLTSVGTPSTTPRASTLSPLSGVMSPQLGSNAVGSSLQRPGSMMLYDYVKLRNSQLALSSPGQYSTNSGTTASGGASTLPHHAANETDGQLKRNGTMDDNDVNRGTTADHLDVTLVRRDRQQQRRLRFLDAEAAVGDTSAFRRSGSFRRMQQSEPNLSRNLGLTTPIPTDDRLLHDMQIDVFGYDAMSADPSSQDSPARPEDVSSSTAPKDTEEQFSKDSGLGHSVWSMAAQDDKTLRLSASRSEAQLNLTALDQYQNLVAQVAKKQARSQLDLLAATGNSTLTLPYSSVSYLPSHLAYDHVGANDSLKHASSAYWFGAVSTQDLQSRAYLLRDRSLALPNQFSISTVLAGQEPDTVGPNEVDYDDLVIQRCTNAAAPTSTRPKKQPKSEEHGSPIADDDENNENDDNDNDNDNDNDYDYDYGRAASTLLDHPRLFAPHPPSADEEDEGIDVEATALAGWTRNWYYNGRVDTDSEPVPYCDFEAAFQKRASKGGVPMLIPDSEALPLIGEKDVDEVSVLSENDRESLVSDNSSGLVSPASSIGSLESLICCAPPQLDFDILLGVLRNHLELQLHTEDYLQKRDLLYVVDKPQDMLYRLGQSSSADATKKADTIIEVEPLEPPVDWPDRLSSEPPISPVLCGDPAPFGVNRPLVNQGIRLGDSAVFEFSCSCPDASALDVFWFKHTMNGFEPIHHELRPTEDVDSEKLHEHWRKYSVVSEPLVGGISRHSLRVWFCGLEDAAQYSCVLRSRDAHWLAMMASLVVLKPTDTEQWQPPEFLSSLDPLSCAEGDRLEISFKARGTPFPRLLWTINNELVASIDPDAPVEPPEPTPTSPQPDELDRPASLLLEQDRFTVKRVSKHEFLLVVDPVLSRDEGTLACLAVGVNPLPSDVVGDENELRKQPVIAETRLTCSVFVEQLSFVERDMVRLFLGSHLSALAHDPMRPLSTVNIYGPGVRVFDRHHDMTLPNDPAYYNSLRVLVRYLLLNVTLHNELLDLNAPPIPKRRGKRFVALSTQLSPPKAGAHRRSLAQILESTVPSAPPRRRGHEALLNKPAVSFAEFERRYNAQRAAAASLTRISSGEDSAASLQRQQRLAQSAMILSPTKTSTVASQQTLDSERIDCGLKRIDHKRYSRNFVVEPTAGTSGGARLRWNVPEVHQAQLSNFRSRSHRSTPSIPSAAANSSVVVQRLSGAEPLIIEESIRSTPRLVPVPERIHSLMNTGEETEPSAAALRPDIEKSSSQDAVPKDVEVHLSIVNSNRSLDDDNSKPAAPLRGRSRSSGSRRSTSRSPGRSREFDDRPRAASRSPGRSAAGVGAKACVSVVDEGGLEKEKKTATKTKTGSKAAGKAIVRDDSTVENVADITAQPVDDDTESVKIAPNNRVPITTKPSSAGGVKGASRRSRSPRSHRLNSSPPAAGTGTASVGPKPSLPQAVPPAPPVAQRKTSAKLPQWPPPNVASIKSSPPPLHPASTDRTNQPKNTGLKKPSKSCSDDAAISFRTHSGGHKVSVGAADEPTVPPTSTAVPNGLAPHGKSNSRYERIDKDVVVVHREKSTYKIPVNDTTNRSTDSRPAFSIESRDGGVAIRMKGEMSESVVPESRSEFSFENDRKSYANGHDASIEATKEFHLPNVKHLRSHFNDKSAAVASQQSPNREKKSSKRH